MKETLYTYLKIQGVAHPKEFGFDDLEDADGKKGKTAKEQRDEFGAGIIKLDKNADKGHHFESESNIYEDVNANFWDIIGGNGIEPDEVKKEIVQLEGMLNTKTGELEYRTMQVCWCLFFFKMINSKDIGDKIDWSTRIIVDEKNIIRKAFGCDHLDMISLKFFERYPHYVFSNAKEEKEIKKRIRDRRKKR